MKVKDARFQIATQFAFEEVFPTILLPVKSLVQNASAEKDSAKRSILLGSACMLLFGGLRTMAKFYNYGVNTRDDLEGFVDEYFPADYRWQFRKLYRAYEQGLLPYLGHKNSTQPLIFSNGNRPVFSEGSDGTLEVNVEKFLEDFQNSIESFKASLFEEEATQDRTSFCYYYDKIRSTCQKEWK
jgi:hypothetical protein